jgi:DNA-binding XRE family transcriptional regulator
MTYCEFFRKRERMTRARLAALAGCSAKSIERIEAGYERSTLVERAIGKVLGLPPEALSKEVSVSTFGQVEQERLAAAR